MVGTKSSGTFSSSLIRHRVDSAETSALADPLPTDDDEQTSTAPETGARVHRHEKGDALAKDKTAAADTVSLAAEQSAAENRKKIAQEIGEAAKRAISSHGSVKLATALQLLRRSLSKAHDVIGEDKTEANFLSMVVLAETAVSCRKWNDLGKEVFQHIKSVATIGETQHRVTYDDFNQVFRVLNANDLISGPYLDFDATDDEHGQKQDEDVLR